MGPDGLREAVAGALDGGARFAGAHAVAAGPEVAWRVVLREDGRLRGLTTTSRGRVVPTLVDLVPAVAWDEREAHDRFGLRFDGHEPLRPLVDHPDEPAAWTVPVRGPDVHDVAVGPIHAGVIESGHFRFHVVGERILALDAQLFYKHRGLERAAAGAGIGGGLALAGRACAACHVTNSVAFVHAVEAARGMRPTREVQVARTLLLELERLYNHLNDISAVCAGVGFAAGTHAFAALKERAQRVNAALTGHRFLFGSVAVGASALTITEAGADAAREEVRAIRAAAADAWRSLSFAPSVQARLDGVGVLSHADAVRLGAVGPAARASGVPDDARAHARRLVYGADFAAARPLRVTGDVAARLQLRAAELETTTDLLDELLDGARSPAATDEPTVDGHIGAELVESPRGATLCVVELAGGRVARMRLRTGSLANWPVLAHAVAGNLLPDFPLINKSFELCYACADR